MYQGFQYQEIVYGDAALGWVEGIYHPREEKYRDCGTLPKSQEGLRKVHSRVWREIEETGYGIYDYGETVRFFTVLKGDNYVVRAVLANPASVPYGCHIRLNGVVKADNIVVESGEEQEITFIACMTKGDFSLCFLTGSAKDMGEEPVEGDVYVKDIDITPASPKERREKPHLFLVSDSTVQSYEMRSYPQTGWGQVLCRFFRGAEECETYPVKYHGQKVGKGYELPELVIDNRAIAGRSARSFYNEGRLDQIMEELCPGDYMFVQFAHNDDNALRPNRYIAPEEFPAFLSLYLDACEKRGAQCVFVTPVTMMVTDEEGRFRIAFQNYREKMMELAAERNVPLLDLGKRSTDFLNEIGWEKSKEIYLWAEEGEYPESTYAPGVSDKAHLQEYGAMVYANLVTKLMMEYTTDNRLEGLKKLAMPKEIKELVRPARAKEKEKETSASAQEAHTTVPGKSAEVSGKDADMVTGFVAQEVSVEGGARGLGTFLLNWNQPKGAVAFQVYARKKGEALFQEVKTITREEKEAYATLPFSAQAGFLWEYCVRAVFENGKKGHESRVIEIDLR